MRTAQEFQEQAKKLKISRWNISACSICNFPVFYCFNEQGQVGFYPGCGCTDSGETQLRSWQEVADHYNMQTSPKYIAEMDAFWQWGT